MQTLNVGECFGEGWGAMKKYLGPAILGTLVYMVIAVVAVIIPIVGGLISLVISGPLVGGFITLLLNIAADRNPAVGDVFKGFSRFVPFLATYLLLAVIGLICFVPAFLLSLIGLVFGAKGFVVLLVILGLAALVVYIIIMLRYCLALFIVADDPSCGVIDAFKRSEVLTRGQRPTIFVIALLAWLLSVVGMLLLFVGVLFTAPLAGCAMTAMYRKLKGSAAGGAAGGAAPGATPTV